MIVIKIRSNEQSSFLEHFPLFIFIRVTIWSLVRFVVFRDSDKYFSAGRVCLVTQRVILTTLSGQLDHNPAILTSWSSPLKIPNVEAMIKTTG